MASVPVFCLKSVFSSFAWENLNYKGGSVLSWLDQWLLLALYWGKKLKLIWEWHGDPTQIKSSKEVIGILLVSELSEDPGQILEAVCWSVWKKTGDEGGCVGQGGQKVWRVKYRYRNIYLISSCCKHRDTLLSGEQLHWLIKSEVCELQTFDNFPGNTKEVSSKMF